MDVLPVLQEMVSAPTAEKRESLRKALAQYLNHLLLYNFSSLVQLLYQVDVPEKKLKAVLEAHPTEDAGNLIADLLIERQREKKELKNRFQFPLAESDEERW